jgi:hypothetical protein
MTGLPKNSGSRRSASSSTAACTGTLTINLVWGNDRDVSGSYMRNSRVAVGGEVTVRVTGPIMRENRTTSGQIVFGDLPCGDYMVSAIFTGTDPLVERARREVGSTRWNYSSAITSLDGTLEMPGNTNKCNFFVYDMIQQVHGSAPTYTYARRFTFGLWTRTVPDLAGSWAEHDNSANDKTEGWRNITYRGARAEPVRPGSILGISAAYSDATGHVGIISYPAPATIRARVAGARHTVAVIMQGQTISADSRRVVENDWGFRTSSSPATNSLNSPAAGIEVKT